MNRVALMGRLVKDPEISEKYARYTLAVNRKYKTDGGQNADFINCVTFGKNKDFAAKWLTKGMQIAVFGEIQTGSYEKDGQKVFTTNVVVNEHEFCGSKADNQATQPSTPDLDKSSNEFMTIPDNAGDELPFG
jgi:single-strand DNA-binding protein